MADLADATDDELRAELSRRGDSMGTCPTCRKWKAYVGTYDTDGRTLRCRGCLRAVSKCWCR